jgi:hypothetical protein
MATLKRIRCDGDLNSQFPFPHGVSGAWPDSSQAEISSDEIALLGKWGLIVPAVTVSPLSNFIRAKSLASVSVSNVLVKRGLRLCAKVPLLGTSNVTYHV